MRFCKAKCLNRERTPIWPIGKAFQSDQSGKHFTRANRENIPIGPIGKALQSDQSGKSTNRANRENIPIGPIGKALQSGQSGKSTNRANRENTPIGSNRFLFLDQITKSDSGWRKHDQTVEKARSRIGYKRPDWKPIGQTTNGQIARLGQISIRRNLAIGPDWARLIWRGALTCFPIGARTN